MVYWRLVRALILILDQYRWESQGCIAALVQLNRETANYVLDDHSERAYDEYDGWISVRTNRQYPHLIVILENRGLLLRGLRTFTRLSQFLNPVGRTLDGDSCWTLIAYLCDRRDCSVTVASIGAFRLSGSNIVL